jgi:hypothetical protein
MTPGLESVHFSLTPELTSFNATQHTPGDARFVDN